MTNHELAKMIMDFLEYANKSASDPFSVHVYRPDEDNILFIKEWIDEIWSKEIMNEIHVEFDIKDFDKVDRLNEMVGYYPLYQYAHDAKNHKPTEWGKLILGNHKIVFHGVNK